MVRHFFPSLDLEKIGINEFNEAAYQSSKLIDIYRGNKFDMISYSQKRKREIEAYRAYLESRRK